MQPWNYFLVFHRRHRTAETGNSPGYDLATLLLESIWASCTGSFPIRFWKSPGTWLLQSLANLLHNSVHTIFPQFLTEVRLLHFVPVSLWGCAACCNILNQRKLLKSMSSKNDNEMYNHEIYWPCLHALVITQYGLWVQ